MNETPHQRCENSPHTSILRQAAGTLRELLDSGKYQPGERLPSHRQLSRDLGISHVTLQRALEAMRGEGRIVRHRGCGTFVAEVGQRRAAGTIAVVTRALFDPSLSSWDSACARGVATVLTDARVSFHFYPNQPLSLEPGSNKQTVDPHVLSDADEGALRGVLVLGEISISHPAAYRHLRQHAVPVVEMSWSTRPGTPRALLDYPQLATEAMEFARRAGRRTVGWLASRLAGPTQASDPLWKALRKSARLPGLTSRREWQRKLGVLSQEGGYEEFRKLWAQRHRPEALVITDDVAAAGAARAMVELGVDVPGELMVIAHANVGATLQYPLPFFRIGMDATAAVRQAWALLEESMRDPSLPPREVRVAPQWIEQEAGKRVLGVPPSP